MCPSFLFKSSKTFITSSAFLLSKLPVGSSASIIAGSLKSALPIETLCCWPPDNWFGSFFLCSVNSSISNILFNLSLLIFLPSKLAGNVIFSSTFNIGSKLKNWYIIPTLFLLYFASLLPLSLRISSPSTKILPLVGVSTPPKHM